MDSNSWNKALDLIFNILPRTVAPLRAISYSVKKNKEKIWQNFFFQNYFKKSFREIATFTSRLPPRFLSNVMNLSATLHKRIKETESERKFWELTVWCSLSIICTYYMTFFLWGGGCQMLTFDDKGGGGSKNPQNLLKKYMDVP